MIEDLKFALRQFHKARGFSLAVIATLALGVGVNTAVFSMVDGFLLRRSPYPEPEKIAALMTHVEGMNGNTEEDNSFNTTTWQLVHDNVSTATVAAYEGQVESSPNGVNLNAGRLGGGVALCACEQCHGPLF